MLLRFSELDSGYFKFLRVGLLACLAFAGCATLDSKTENEKPDPDEQIGGTFHKATPPGQQLGTEPRSREIERHLGVH
jgi:hypothetical protein